MLEIVKRLHNLFAFVVTDEVINFVDVHPFFSRSSYFRGEGGVVNMETRAHSLRLRGRLFGICGCSLRSF